MRQKFIDGAAMDAVIRSRIAELEEWDGPSERGLPVPAIPARRWLQLQEVITVPATAKLDDFMGHLIARVRDFQQMVKMCANGRITYYVGNAPVHLASSGGQYLRRCESFDGWEIRMRAIVSWDT